MKAFQRMGIPDRKVENYKYTDLTKLFARENYNRAFRPTSFDFDMQEVFTCDVPEFDTHIIFHVNDGILIRTGPISFRKEPSSKA